MKYIIYLISILVISTTFAYGLKFVTEYEDKNIEIIKGFEKIQKEYNKELIQENFVEQKGIDAKTWLINRNKKNIVIIKYETYIKNVKKELNDGKIIVELENSGEKIKENSGTFSDLQPLIIKIETNKDIDEVFVKEKKWDK